MGGYLGYCDEPLSSTDFATRHVSSTFDSSAGIMLDTTFVKLLALYDAEWGYSCRMVDWMHVHGVRVTASAIAAAQSLVQLGGSFANAGKLTAMAFRVPTIDVAVERLTAEYKHLRVLCSDYSACGAHTCEELLGPFDATVGIRLDATFVQQVARCDCEWGYSCRLVDFIKHMAKKVKPCAATGSRRRR